MKSESGQTLIIIVIGFVVILGFVGLAIDAGMVYADRRNAQNAADAASLAGGAAGALDLENSHIRPSAWNCMDARVQGAMADARLAAIYRARGNGFTIGEDPATDNYVVTDCGSNTNTIGVAEFYLDVTVHISTTTRAGFVQIILGNKGLSGQVEAVTRVRSRQPYAFGNAIVALNPDGCSGEQNGAGFHGTPQTQVFGGGIFSNGCLQMDGSASAWIEQPWTAYYGTECSKCSSFTTGAAPGSGSISFTPNASPVKITIEDYAIDEPDCTGHWVSQVGGTLIPGLYCINGDLTMNDTIGLDITIVVTGKLTINGNATLVISALPAGAVSVNGAIPGVLFYIPQGNPGPVKINGTSASRFQGVIYAPGATVDLSGTGDLESYQSQVIGWNVYTGGVNVTGIHYDDLLNAQKPTTLDFLH